jgi:hypothetical protein
VRTQRGKEVKTRPSVIVVAAGAAALWIVAVLAVAAYYVPTSGVRYGYSIDWRHLVGMVPSVGSREIGIVLGWWDVAFWCSLLLWSVLMLAPPSRIRRWAAVVTPLVLLCPVNLLGGFAAISDWFLTPSDGEMLAEHWPVLHVYAAWTVLAAVAPPLMHYIHARGVRQCMSK